MGEMIGSSRSLATMKISALYVYPIKSLRGVSVPTATMTKHGFPYDRRYMLLKVKDTTTNPQAYENMHVSEFATMCLFTTALQIPGPSEAPSGAIHVTYTNPSSGHSDSLCIPLTPDTATLDTLPVSMHQSQTTARAMPDRYSAWFSAHFGFPVILAYLGADNYRQVLGNIAPNSGVRNANLHAQKTAQSTWLGALASRASSLLPGTMETQSGDDDDEANRGYEITFADCAPYLVVSQTSVEDASRRLPDGEEMDVTKFRPNIVVSGAAEAYEEDYWGKLCIGGGDASDADEEETTMTTTTTLLCTANCLRCTSLNVDYATGTFATKEGILKKLQKDRRVDTGVPYSPCFGRYSFMASRAARDVSVGDAVSVLRRNDERTTFKWPGLGTTKKDNLYPV